MSTSFENTLSIAGVELYHLRREELDACDGHRMETVAAVGAAGVQDEGAGFANSRTLISVTPGHAFH